MTHNLVTFHRMWPRKYGLLNFAILECSLKVWIVNQTVFAAPEVREKCVAKYEFFTSLFQMTSHKPFFDRNFKHQYLPHYAIFLGKSYKTNQWNLPNILAYISGISNDFVKGGLVPLMWPGGVTFGVIGSSFFGNVSNCRLNSYGKFGGAMRRRFFAIYEKPEGEGRITAPRPCAG